MLTAKQEKFCQNIVKGMTQVDAYRDAYNTSKSADKTVHENACRLAADSKIVARVNELRKQIATDSIMSAQERLKWLTDLMRSADESTSDKLRAADIMNKMTGEYVTKVEADVKNEVTINVELVDD